jgi:methionyl-tRNA synthetase
MTAGEPRTFYITTPIYYVNDVPHLGHAYCTIAADVLGRYKRLCGLDVRFTTGTDEHGEKIAQAAREAGREPAEYCDRIVNRFVEAWKVLDIRYDDFIRTTEARHRAGVERFVRLLSASDDIYPGTYQGWYCVREETFWPESRLASGQPCPKCERRLSERDDGLFCELDGSRVDRDAVATALLCPDCLRPVKRVEEQNYFFRLSRYQELLRQHFETHPDFVSPPHRKAEMLALLREGLTDVSITRTSFTWGIPFPGHEGHVIYVWFEALMNYINSAGFSDDGSPLARYWPADVHLIGKDIARFHTLLWPAMLAAAGQPLPVRVFLTGMITNKGVKMSKSLGNVIDPFELAGRYGTDAVRFTLLREVVLGHDGDFSEEALVARYNSELANGIGNLVARSVSMIEKYRAGRVPDPGREDGASGPDREVVGLARDVPPRYADAMDRLGYNVALDEAFRLVRRLDKYVDESAPWSLHKARDARLDRVLYNLAEGLRVVSILVEPFIPGSAARIREQLGVPGAGVWSEIDWGRLAPGTTVSRGPAIFPRIGTAS